MAAAILWGTTGTAQALAPPGGTPLVVGSLRLVVGGIALLIIALIKGKLPALRDWPIKSSLLAALCIAAYQLLFFAGVARTGVAIGTIVGIGSSPILAGILTYFITHERPERAWIIATMLAVIGCTLLIATRGKIKIDPAGLILAIGAGGAYAAFTLASKKLLETQPPDTAMAIVFCLGAVLVSPLLLTIQSNWLGQPGTWLVILHLGIITVALAYSFFGAGLKDVPAATAVTLTLAEPLTAGLLGVLVLGERLSLPAGIGILLIFIGLVILSASRGSGSESFLADSPGRRPGY